MPSERRLPVRGTRWARVARLGIGAALLTVSLTACSTNQIKDDLRFGWPSGVTNQAEKMRTLWTWSSVFALFVGVIVWGLIFWCCIRYRKRDEHTIPRQLKFNLPLEIAYTIVPFLIVIGLFYFTVTTENYVDKKTAHPAVTVEVVAFKWNWQFDYQQSNGAATNYPGTTQPVSTIGTTEQIPVLVIPRGETVRFIEHSQDVIHAFWVPEFLFKRDVIPYGTTSTSKDNQFEITATSDGSYVGRCAELCGTYHSQMNFEVRVVEPDVYAKYIAALTSLGPTDPAAQPKALVAAGMGPCATTTHPFNTDRSARTASSNPGNCT
jgi:cytochrome c oxidase subunit II